MVVIRQVKHNSQLMSKSEGAEEGYYVVFDHRSMPEPRVETEILDGLTVRSYVIPVMQERPSD